MVHFPLLPHLKLLGNFPIVNYLFLLRSYFLSLDLDLLLIQLSPVSLVICITPIAGKRIVPLTPFRQTAIMLILTSLPTTSPRIRNVAILVSIAFCLSLASEKEFFFPGRSQDNFFAGDLHDMSKTS